MTGARFGYLKRWSSIRRAMRGTLISFSRRRHFFVVMLFICVCLLLYSLSLYRLSNGAEIDVLESSLVKHPKPKSLNITKPLILLWTPYFSGDWIEKGFDVKCLENECLAISNRAYLQYANAVLFHWRDIALNDLPKVRYFHQKWVLYNMESPANTNTGYLKSILESVQMHIDWTMSYRHDSDVYSPYGYVVDKGSQIITSPVLSTKKLEIAWFVSNCDTPGKREDYVKELSNYINVDVYGECGELQCSKDDNEKCLKKLETEYKFYLSFENSICKDYVTEKLFRVMSYNVIPIVFGGANYVQILPPNSFVDALSFKSPLLLSKYLKLVSNNETLYNSFFEWRKNYSIITSISSGLCFLCEKLYKNEKSNETKKKLNRDLVKWWFNEANCSSWNSL